eukprot:IDg9594t1
MYGVVMKKAGQHAYKSFDLVMRSATCSRSGRSKSSRHNEHACVCAVGSLVRLLAACAALASTIVSLLCLSSLTFERLAECKLVLELPALLAQLPRGRQVGDDVVEERAHILR